AACPSRSFCPYYLRPPSSSCSAEAQVGSTKRKPVLRHQADKLFDMGRFVASLQCGRIPLPPQPGTCDRKAFQSTAQMRCDRPPCKYRNAKIRLDHLDNCLGQFNLANAGRDNPLRHQNFLNEAELLNWH